MRVLTRTWAYIKALDAVQDAFRCAVVVVHHCGINDTRPRGHTSLTGAADAQLAVKRGDGVITVTVEWMKDGEEGGVIGSKLSPVEVGEDDEGDPIISCVVEPADASAVTKVTKARTLTARQKNAMTALVSLIASCGEPVPAMFGLPNDISCVPVSAWRDDLLRRGDVDPNGKNPRKDFSRLKDQLKAHRKIAEKDDLVWLSKADPLQA